VRARLDFLLHWLDARRPDIVGIQELKVNEEGLPVDVLADAGYHLAACCQAGWNGVAVLAREAPEVMRRGLPGAEEWGARLLDTRVAGLRFVTVYVPNGKTVRHPDFQMKLDWMDALHRYVRDHLDPALPTVLCGDMNISPGPLDSWNEALLRGGIFHTDEERTRFAALLDWGFVDLFRDRHPEAQQFSWWDYRAGAFHKGHGLRIDFVLATAPVSARVEEVVIDREYRKKKDGLIASDHAPVYADLAEM
jgi:exodeoxyribonuclease-3